jgi:transposase InsO family protein
VLPRRSRRLQSSAPLRRIQRLHCAARQAPRRLSPAIPGRLRSFENACIERFNRTFREELLDQHLFARLDDVREAAWWWMLDYNEERPHDALGGMTPAERKAQAAESSRNTLSA